MLIIDREHARGFLVTCILALCSIPERLPHLGVSLAPPFAFEACVATGEAMERWDEQKHALYWELVPYEAQGWVDGLYFLGVRKWQDLLALCESDLRSIQMDTVSIRRLHRLLHQLPFPFLYWLDVPPHYILSADEVKFHALYPASSNAEMVAIGKLQVVIGSSAQTMDEVKCMAECSQALLHSLPSSCGDVTERKQAISTAVRAGNATSHAFLFCHSASQEASSFRKALQHALRSIRDVIVLRTQMACESNERSVFIKILEDVYGGPLQEGQMYQLLKARSKVVLPLFSSTCSPATELDDLSRLCGVIRKASPVCLAHQQTGPSAVPAFAPHIQWLGSSEVDASGSVLFTAPKPSHRNSSSTPSENALMSLRAPPGIDGMLCDTPYPR